MVRYHEPPMGQPAGQPNHGLSGKSLLKSGLGVEVVPAALERLLDLLRGGDVTIPNISSQPPVPCQRLTQRIRVSTPVEIPMPLQSLRFLFEVLLVAGPLSLVLGARNLTKDKGQMTKD